MESLLDTLGASDKGNQFFFMAKNLWRQGYARAPDFCSMDTPEDECRVRCPEALWKDRNMSGYDVLIETGQMHFIDSFSSELLGNASAGVYAHEHRSYADARQ